MIVTGYFVYLRHLYLLYVNHLCYGGANDEDIGRAIIANHTKVETYLYCLLYCDIILVYIPLTRCIFYIILFSVNVLYFIRYVCT